MAQGAGPAEIWNPLQVCVNTWTRVCICTWVCICVRAHVCTCHSEPVQNEPKGIMVYMLESQGSFQIDKPGFPMEG